MKIHFYQKPSFFAKIMSNFSKNFTALFDSGNKREFQRLKDFIAS